MFPKPSNEKLVRGLCEFPDVSHFAYCTETDNGSSRTLLLRDIVATKVTILMGAKVKRSMEARYRETSALCQMMISKTS